jgi:hypothetical protein
MMYRWLIPNLTSYVPTPCLKMVVFVIVLCVTVIVTTNALVPFHIERVCTLLYVLHE